MNKHVTAGALVLLLATMGACETRTPEQLRPTHGGWSGECLEWDGEPCDDDPFDTDDDHPVWVPGSPKPSPKTPITRKPMTTTTRRR